MTIEALAFVLWFAFLIGWYLAAFWISRGKASVKTREAWGYFVAWGVGFALLFSRFTAGRVAVPPPSESTPGLLAPLWRAPLVLGVALIVVQVGAFAFGSWARLHMGRLWSGMITVRENHRVIDTGPFALVRHPIYFAFILASWALALICAAPASLAGAAVLTVLMVVKARSEERFLRSQLGEAAYDAYAARTPQIIPLIGWR